METLPLVIFTLLTQMAVGLALLGTIRRVALADGPAAGGRMGGRMEWGAVLALLLIGAAAAFFHLGHPLGFVHTLANLEQSWLSREILAFALFGVLTALVVVVTVTAQQSGLTRALMALAAAIGVVAVVVQGMTYSGASMDAIAGGVPVVFFALTSVILGTAVGSYFMPADRRSFPATILGYALVVALVVYLILPLVWLSGGTTMRETGEAFLGSPLYWLRIVFGLALPLGVVWWLRRVPVWLPPVLVVSEIIGRIIFFSLIAHSATTLGLPQG